jgi:hypothetical protein
MDAQEKEDLRHAILKVVADRHPAALPVRAISRHAAREVGFAFRDEDAEAQCLFLVGMHLLAQAPDPLGSTKYFSATPQGVLARERGMNPQPPSTKE